MSARSCPDWPTLLELAPDLHFKHYTVAEAKLPTDALVDLHDVRGGAEEVGRVTTATVVTSFFLVIVAVSLFTIGHYLLR